MPFDWTDPLLLEQQRTSDERAVRDAAYDDCQGSLAPRILAAFRREKTDPAIFRERGELGRLESTFGTEPRKREPNHGSDPGSMVSRARKVN